MTLRLAAFFATALVTSTFPSPAQNYNITDLGAVAGEGVSAGYGLNGSGQAAGVSSGPSGAIATLFSNGLAVNLGTLEPLDVSIATAINRSGEIVGYEPFPSDPSNTYGAFHAFLYSNGSMKDIHSPSLFPAGTRAAGINSSGQVVGEGQLDSWSFHVFLYSNGKMVDLGPPGAFQASAAAINDSGQIVGSYYTAPGNAGAFLYSNGKFTNLGVPAGATSTSAFAINSLGQIAGAIYIPGTAHGGFYHNGNWTDLGAFSGVATHATGINTAGQIVGTAFFPQTSYHPSRPGKHVGLIFRSGAAIDLDTLIPLNSGFTITDAIAINDAGEILCDAKNARGTGRAVLLIPK
jgi:probable HAF family extracellular repeat protein